MQPVHMVPVARIRPEEGLARKRAKEGHEELCASIRQFGVLTPITVREAEDGSGDYLLVKGQGRTLAARLLGMDVVPAVIASDDFTQVDKVQQFLVENVARLKMRPVDKALLIAHARAAGEETSSVARRFGISATTVRRLQATIEDATPAEIAALRDGKVSLALHAVVARRVVPEERSDALRVLSAAGISAQDADRLLHALDWRRLQEQKTTRADRLALLAWTCARLAENPRGSFPSRLARVARQLPFSASDLLHAPSGVCRAAL